MPWGARTSSVAENEFIARASGFDFRIAKPWGDSDSYDVLVGFEHGFWRVRVKRATRSRGEYVTKAGGGSSLYTKDDIDFIAAHLTLENVWYIVPIEAFEGRSTLQFNPRTRGKRRYERYREAWCLLACDPKARGWKDIPVVCRCKELPERCAVCPNKEK